MAATLADDTADDLTILVNALWLEGVSWPDAGLDMDLMLDAKARAGDVVRTAQGMFRLFRKMRMERPEANINLIIAEMAATRIAERYRKFA